jgi:sensor histidine kinase YesM
MKTRYEDLVEYQWDIDDSLNDVCVPKLILQPLVENCFKHGFSDKPPVWKIGIRSYRRDNCWFVSISDNGSGFTQEKIQELKSRIDEHKVLLSNYSGNNPLEMKGLGLENTAMRLFIFFSGMERFEIKSQDGETIVEIGGVLSEEYCHNNNS